MSADVVLGMCTILLLESALLGIPTVSIQPGLRTPDALPMMPDLLRVYREEELDTVLRSALAKPPSDRPTGVPPAALRGHAAGKVSKLMYELLGMSE
jgi:predicted glycosyltransferase